MLTLSQDQFRKHCRDIGFKKGYRQENESQLDYPHPMLRDLSIVIGIIRGLHPHYTLFSVRYISARSGKKRRSTSLLHIIGMQPNGWMFSFLVQGLLVWLAEAAHQMTPHARRYQGLAVRTRVLSFTDIVSTRASVRDSSIPGPAHPDGVTDDPSISPPPFPYHLTGVHLPAGASGGDIATAELSEQDRHVNGLGKRRGSKACK
jgi:hypothetical protein